jgi:hypothetical protein
MCSHHLIEPVACTPASGWEKGQVENQVGNLRDQLFRPKPRVKSLTELNARREDQCIAYARRTKHPEFKDRTIWEVFQDERTSLIELRGPFDGFVERHQHLPDHGRSQSLQRRRSAAGRMVLVRSHAERIVVLLNGEVVADHPRQFRRDRIIYDPWHYLPVLVKKTSPRWERQGIGICRGHLQPRLRLEREQEIKRPDLVVLIDRVVVILEPAEQGLIGRGITACRWLVEVAKGGQVDFVRMPLIECGDDRLPQVLLP